MERGRLVRANSIQSEHADEASALLHELALHSFHGGFKKESADALIIWLKRSLANYAPNCYSRAPMNFPEQAREIAISAPAKFRYSICTLVTRPEEYAEMVESFVGAGFDSASCEYLYINNSQ